MKLTGQVLNQSQTNQNALINSQENIGAFSANNNNRSSNQVLSKNSPTILPLKMPVESQKVQFSKKYLLRSFRYRVK